MLPEDKGTLKCKVCGDWTGRVAPQVCTKCFLAGTPIPEVVEEKPPLYISDKEKKPTIKKSRG